MIRRFLSRNREFYALLNSLRAHVCARYSSYVNFHFSENLPVGFGQTYDSILFDPPVNCYTGVGDLFSNFDKEQFRRNISESDVVQVVVSSFHECRHGMMFASMKSGQLDDAEHFEAVHLACYDNDAYLRHNWISLISEVDAERYGIQEAGLFLADYFGDEKASNLLLQYVNSRICDSDYFILYPEGKSRFDEIGDVFNAFDEAYERAKHAHREYVLPKCKDVFQNFMYGEMSDEARAKFFAEQDGFQQDKMVAAVTLYHHPEYQSQYPVLRECDMSMEAMFGSTWSKSEASLESSSDVKSGTKVNRGIRHPRLNQKACGVELRELDMTHDGEDECEY